MTRALAWACSFATLAVTGACALPESRPPPIASETQTDKDTPARLPIFAPAYGAADALPEALEPGAALDVDTLSFADGGTLELAELRRAGPFALVWIGGAEHEWLTQWVEALDGALSQLEARGASLVFVRPLAPEAALRWAEELGLQTPVAVGGDGRIAAALGLGPEADASLDFAVLIVDEAGALRYRKLGGRRPELDELLAALEGDASWRCCPREPCPAPACEQE